MTEKKFQINDKYEELIKSNDAFFIIERCQSFEQSDIKKRVSIKLEIS